MAETIHSTSFTGNDGDPPDPTRFRTVVSGTDSRVSLDGAGNLAMRRNRSNAEAELWPLDTDGTDYNRPNGDHTFAFTLASNDRVWLYLALTTAGSDAWQLRLDPSDDDWRVQVNGATQEGQPFTFTTGTTYWVRVRWLDDGTFRFKLWSGTAGDEPGGTGADASWTGTYTSANVGAATGYRIFANYFTGDNTYLWSQSDLTDPGAVPVNNPPIVNAGADDLAIEEQAYSHAVSATDPDGDPVALTCSALPSGLTFTDHGDNTGTVSGTPAAGTAAGSPYTITITGDDGTDTHQDAYTLTVNAPIAELTVEQNGAAPETALDLSWPEDPSAVEYRIERNGAVVHTTTATTWTDTGLTPGTQYTYRVQAVYTAAGPVLDYSTVQDSGTPVVLSDATAQKPTFTAPSHTGTANDTIQLTGTVTDTGNLAHSAIVTYTVVPVDAPVGSPMKLLAGPVVAPSGTARVTLRARLPLLTGDKFVADKAGIMPNGRIDWSAGGLQATRTTVQKLMDGVWKTLRGGGTVELIDGAARVLDHEVTDGVADQYRAYAEATVDDIQLISQMSQVTTVTPVQLYDFLKVPSNWDLNRKIMVADRPEARYPVLGTPHTDLIGGHNVVTSAGLAKQQTAVSIYTTSRRELEAVLEVLGAAPIFLLQLPREQSDQEGESIYLSLMQEVTVGHVTRRADPWRIMTIPFAEVARPEVA